ncbi:MAG TPA: hypothetical protein DCS93_34730 [Microscillaceae bacterium]|nr:hypothetical protein [Microscillaceae bacterium]
MEPSRRAADYLFERSEFNPLRRSEASLGNTGYSRGIFWFVFFAEEKNERLYWTRNLKLKVNLVLYGFSVRFNIRWR